MWQRGSWKSDIFVAEHKRQKKWRPRWWGMSDIMAAGGNQWGRHWKQECLHPVKCPFSLLLTLISSSKTEEMSIYVFPHQNLNSLSWFLWIIWIHGSKASSENKVWIKLNVLCNFHTNSVSQLFWQKNNDRTVQQITCGSKNSHSPANATYQLVKFQPVN